MATPPEHPWSNYEKNYLLAEIIKVANPTPDVLLNIIRNHGIQPRWEDIPLPPGRSLNSSRFAFDELWRTLSMPSMGAPLGPHTPTPMSAPVTLKRPFPYEGPYSAGATGREIRPKPSTLGLGYAQPSPTASEPSTKRKRGRPTKVEAQRRAAEAAAAAASASTGDTGIVAAPTSLQNAPAQTPMTATTPSTAASGPPEEVKSTLPPVTRMPIAAMLTPSTREPKSGSHSSSSSGKRRRARSTKSEPEESSTTRQGPEYESPYSRFRAGREDSPARTETDPPATAPPR